MKKLLRNPLVQWLLSGLIMLYINLVYYTTRWTIKGEELLSPYNKEGSDNAIFVFWHGRLLLLPKFKPKARKNHVIVSVHSDGEMIARALRLFSLELIRGSSRKGGVGALIKAKKVLQQGDNIILTPDGPKGPRMRVSGNVIALAKSTGKRIVPVTFSSSRAVIFNSWDKFLMPLPFGKGIVICGNPVAVPAGDDDKIYNQKLEEELNRITREADIVAGITPVSPAPPKGDRP